MYTICNGCKHVLNRPRLDDYDIDEWRGDCAKRNRIWAHKNASGGVGLFPVGKGKCPHLEGSEKRMLLCTDCKWAPPLLEERLPRYLTLTCDKGHRVLAAADYFCDVPVTSLIRENHDFCSDHDNGNHPTRFERVLSDIL